MQDDWTQAVRTEYVGGDVRFDFPVRPLGWARLAGVFLIGFSVMFDWGPFQNFWQAQHNSQGGPSGGFGFVFNLFQLAFLLAGLFPMFFGLGIIFGRCRVEWKDGRLRSTEMLGPLRWTRRLPCKPVAKLEVAAASRTDSGGNSPPQALERFSGLAVVFEDGTKNLLVMGYPKAWVLGVAEKLRGYVGQGSSASRIFAAPVVQVVEATSNHRNDDDVLQQPAGSRVQVITLGNGLRLVIPPAGFWRGAKGFVFMPIIWCGFMAVFTTLVFLPGTDRHESMGMILLMLFPFWAVGIAMLAFVVQLGKRSAEIVVEGRQLRVTIKGLWGAKDKKWNLGEIASIRADDSGMKLNDRSVIELQIHPRGEKKVGLLAGREEQELRWLATRLRQAVQVPARMPGE